MIMIRTLTIILLTHLFFAPLSFGQKQEENVPPLVGIYHAPEYTGSDLPVPGAPLSLKVQLFNTHDVNITLQTYATLDGKLIELVPSKVYLNRDDYPEYVIDAYAPVVSFSYYFVATSPDGQVVRSDTFALQRPCIPSITPVSDEIVADRTEGQEYLTELVHKAWALEAELKAYESAKGLIEQINQELVRIDGGGK